MSVNVRRMPQTTGERSPKQLKQQARISLAAAYWRNVKADSARMAIYRALPRVPGLGPYHFASRDFAHPPVIGEIDLSAYFGRMGESIRIQATDDTAVAEVTVQILDMKEALLEEGPAQRDGTSDWWVYAGRQSSPSGQSLSIRVSAKDHPGNCTVKACFGYAR